MTIFGWDISDFDLDRGLTASEMRAGYGVGIRFFTAKLTETAPGQTFTHNRATGLLTGAKDVYPYVGSYIVPRSGVSVTVQTSNAISAANRLIPWWKTERGFFWQVDLEHWEYDAVPLWIGVTMCNELKARTGKPVVLYASGGHYGNDPVSPYPRWNPNYVLWQQVGDFRDLYRRSEAAIRDPDYEGMQPWEARGTVIWQYSDSAIIAGQRSCDANAFRGTVEDFGRMLGIERPDTPATATTSAPLAVRAILRGEV